MRYLILAVFSAMAFSACGQSIDTAEWTEEVRLSDGSIVQVWRKERAYSYGFPNAKRGGRVESAIAYLPQSARWQYTHAVTSVQEPISFDIFDGAPYLVIYVADAAFCRSRPPNAYRAQVLRWSDGRWIEVAQTQAPLDRMLMNLAPDPWGHTTKDDFSGLIRLGDKSILGPSKGGIPGTVLAYLKNGPQTCGKYLQRHGVGS
jgi:hypothetical protein